MEPNWIETNGRRPDLPDGTLIEVRVHKGYMPYLEPHPVEWWGSPRDWTGVNSHYRLAQPVSAQAGKVECVHLWGLVDYKVSCMYCGHIAGSKPSPRHEDSSNGVPQDSLKEAASPEHPSSKAHASRPVGTPSRLRNAFGLKDKYPTESAQRVHDDFPVNAMREWK